MIYETRLTIPKNTPATAPVSATMQIHPGLVKQVEITFPPGPAGLAHVYVYYWEHQLWPSNPDSDFAGDDVHLVFPEDIEIVDPPFEFTLYGYNLDDTFPHTPIFRVTMVPFDKDIRSLLAAFALGPRGAATMVEG